MRVKLKVRKAFTLGTHFSLEVEPGGSEKRGQAPFPDLRIHRDTAYCFCMLPLSWNH